MSSSHPEVNAGARHPTRATDLDVVASHASRSLTATRRSTGACQSRAGRRLMPDLGGLPALDAAVGMVFVFFLLSTACSMVNESIANVLGWRAKTLEDAIRNLLGDPKVKRGW